MIAPESVTECFREVLRRDPLAADRAAFAAAAPDRKWLVHELEASVEYRTVVRPLVEQLVAEWQSWAFRAPTAAELQSAVLESRARCGDDDQTRRALADGSIRNRLGFRPLKIELDLTNQCNLRCVMCNFSQPSYHRAPRRRLTVDKFAEIAEQAFHRACDVSLSYGTEPLMHPQFERILALAGAQRVPHVYMNTNGLLLRERTIEAMIGHGMHSVFVSVDAATRETYEKVRVGASFDRLVDRLRMLRDIKAAHGVDQPVLRLGFVLMRHNVHELPAFIDFAARVEARSVNAMHMVSWAAVGNESMGANHVKDRCNDALAAAGARAAALGIEFVAPPRFGAQERLRALEDRVQEDRVLEDRVLEDRVLEGPVPKEHVLKDGAVGRDFGVPDPARGGACCPFPWGFAAIDPSGYVMPCGWWDMGRGGAMGNVYDDDFLTIWRGAAYQRLRERVAHQVLAGPCARCPAAGMGSPDAPRAFSVA